MAKTKTTTQRITKQDVAKEIAAAKKRLKTIERHTGAHLSLNTERIMNDPNRAGALESLKNINWNKLEQGASFKKGFVNMTVEGKYYNTKQAGWITTQTEVQENYVPRLIKASARREKITGEMEAISISGKENIEKAIKYKQYFKSEKQWERYQKHKTKTVIDNFRSNLADMLEYGNLTTEERKKIKKLRRLMRQNPPKWRKIIEDHKLYDIAGVNMYDSDEQMVDLKDYYTDIIETIEAEVGDINDLPEDERKYIRKTADKAARKIVKTKEKAIKDRTKELEDLTKAIW